MTGPGITIGNKADTIPTVMSLTFQAAHLYLQNRFILSISKATSDSKALGKMIGFWPRQRKKRRKNKR